MPYNFQNWFWILILWLRVDITRRGLNYSMRHNNVFNNLVEAIGSTPLVRLNRSITGIKAKVFAKLEGYNPGLSSKDRTVLYMVEDALANRESKEKPTFIEATSGNTGFSLALICALKGYDCILTVPDKISKEKIDAMTSVGAKVYICPSSVMPEDPHSYYSKAASLNEEIPNSIFLNQYYNKSNIRAHYEMTGPEIWEQTEGKITHFIAGVGTGGTISGVARYLKEQNPKIKIYGVDPYGSVLTNYHETGEIDYDMAYKYNIEGIGKNFIPANIDFNIIDKFIQVDDDRSALCAQELAQQEGILVGFSSGAVQAAILNIKDELTEDDFVVGLFADHGFKYLSKIYNDEWLAEKGLVQASQNTEDSIIGSEGLSA